MSTTPQIETRVKINDAILLYPELFEAKEYRPGDGKGFYYSATFVVEKTNPALALLQKAIWAAASKKWNAKAEANVRIAKANNKLPVKDGDLKAGKQYADVFAGRLYIGARNKVGGMSPPPKQYLLTIDPATGLAREVKAGSEEVGQFYPGVRCNVILDLFGYENEGMGIGASISGVQTHNKGERLAGGLGSSASEYDAVPEQAQKAAEQSGGGAAALF